MSQKTYLQITAALFVFIAVLHGLRLVLGWEAVLGGWSVPAWASFVGLALASYLSYSAFKLMK